MFFIFFIFFLEKYVQFSFAEIKTWKQLIEILISFSSVNNNLIHISDWLPTLLHIAKVDGFEKIIKDLDGIDQYENIFTQETVSSRKEIVHDLNILSQTGKYYGALQIEGGWKLILNAEKNEKFYIFHILFQPCYAYSCMSFLL